MASAAFLRDLRLRHIYHSPNFQLRFSKFHSLPDKSLLDSPLNLSSRKVYGENHHELRAFLNQRYLCTSSTNPSVNKALSSIAEATPSSGSGEGNSGDQKNGEKNTGGSENTSQQGKLIGGGVFGMWTLRRASIHLRNRGLSSGAARICCKKAETVFFCLEYILGLIEPHGKLFNGLISSRRFYTTSSSSSKTHSGGVRTFSSGMGANSTGEEDDDLDDGFSELETPGATLGDENNDDDQISKSEVSEEEDDVADDVDNESETFDMENDVSEKESTKIRGTSSMVGAILAAPASSVRTVMDKWVQEGNEVSRKELISTTIELRKRRLFVKALQLLEWEESSKVIELDQASYASRVDLIAKVSGAYKAEEYVNNKIPESFRGDLVYRTVLANYASATNVKKTEEVFNKMRDLKLPIQCFTCDQLILVYKRTDKRKISDVLLFMEKENIKPSIFTYQLLVDAKGKSNDIPGMEKVVETMKAEGLEPNTHIQASLARYYATGGLKDKAGAILKDMGGDDILKNRWACQVMLPIYASLGREDDVGRIWKVCEPNPRRVEFRAVIEAWGQLSRIENAEAAFDKMLKRIRKPSSNDFLVLLNVYAHHKMFAKGKDLVIRMTASGCTITPQTLNAIVKLYVGAGEVGKADSILEKAYKQMRARPLFISYLDIMDKYADKGDIHNAEKIFMKSRQAGYNSRRRQYETLLRAYINAKTPAYGFSERMKADNVFPNNVLARQLAQADAFRNFLVAELLD